MAEKYLARRNLLSRQLLNRRTLALVARSFSLLNNIQRRHRPLANPRPRLALVQRSPLIPLPSSSRSEASWHRSPMVWMGQALPYERGDANGGLPMPAPVRLPGPVTESAPVTARKIAEIPAPPAQFSPRERPRVAVQASSQPTPSLPSPPVEQASEPDSGGSSGLVRGSDLWRRLFPERPSFLRGVRDKEVARQQQRTTKRPPPVVPSKLPRTRTWEITPTDQGVPSLPLPQSPAVEETISRESKETSDSQAPDDQSPSRSRAGPPDQVPPPVQRRPKAPQTSRVTPSPSLQREAALGREPDIRPPDPDAGSEGHDPIEMEAVSSSDVQASTGDQPSIEVTLPKAPVARAEQARPAHSAKVVSPDVKKIDTDGDSPIPDSVPPSPVETVVTSAEIQTRPEEPNVDLTTSEKAPASQVAERATGSDALVARSVETRPAPVESARPSTDKTPRLSTESAKAVETRAALPEPGVVAPVSRLEEDQAVAQSDQVPAAVQRDPTDVEEPPRTERIPGEESTTRVAFRPPVAPAHTKVSLMPDEQTGAPVETPMIRSTEAPTIQPAEAGPVSGVQPSQQDKLPSRHDRVESSEASTPELVLDLSPVDLSSTDVSPEGASELTSVPARVARSTEPQSKAPAKERATAPAIGTDPIEPCNSAEPGSELKSEPRIQRVESRSIDRASQTSAQVPVDSEVDQKRVRVSPSVETAPPANQLKVQAKATGGKTPASARGENGTVRVQAKPVESGALAVTKSEQGPLLGQTPMPLRSALDSVEPGIPPATTMVTRPEAVAQKTAAPEVATGGSRPVLARTGSLPLHLPATLQRVDTSGPTLRSQTRTSSLGERESTQVEDSPSSEPDKDQLAREVYEVIKRRLITERERFWGH